MKRAEKTTALNIRSFSFLFVMVLTALAMPLGLFGQCKSKTIIKNNKNALTPYKYTGAAINDITIGEKEKTIEIEFTAYTGQDYKLLFCPSDNLEEDIQINIFDKRKNIKSRKLIYEGSTKKTSTVSAFEPPKSGNYFIEYKVPSGAEKKEGCIVLVIGYQNTKVKD
jgi:hypothetical protein